MKTLRGYGGLWAALGLAAVVRIPGIGGWAFEPDELSTWRDAASLQGATVSGPGVLGRPVYYLLQHVLLALGRPSPLALRLPALVLGFLGVWATWLVGKRLFGAPAGTVAAVLVALSPWHQYASVFARYWTLVYLLATLAYFALVRAIDEDRWQTYLAALAVLVLGTLTHPTFAFPIVGAVVALQMVTSAGAWKWRWPTWRAVVWLWGPLVVVLAGWAIGLKLTGNDSALRNHSGRGLVATLGIFPGMVQWASPEIIVAAVAGIVWLAQSRAAGDRRWGMLALGGALTGCVFLLAGGRKNDVYADYGMALLPLLYLTIGAVVTRMDGMWLGRVPLWVALTAILVASSLPAVASNLRDGMRFDYRPAYQYVRAAGGAGHLLVGPSVDLQRYYASDLRFEELNSGGAFLQQTLEGTGGFWLLLASHRSGWISEDAAAQSWVDQHCRTALRTERPRFDYRIYRVDLAWCGTTAPIAD